MRSVTHAGLPGRRKRVPGRVSLARRLWLLAVALGVALRVRRERRMLLKLDERALKDIGSGRSAAQIEAHRSFWDIPVDRLRR
jgi:uncharacterized protein YjiS (DUF1127 family)